MRLPTFSPIVCRLLLVLVLVVSIVALWTAVVLLGVAGK